MVPDLNEMNRTGRVEAVCLSEKKGTQKSVVQQISLRAGWGAEGDAHAGKWHRQISLLPKESIEAFRKQGVEIAYGDFGENMVISGLDLPRFPVGTRLRIRSALLEITQIGKACHNSCAIRERTGDCIMPRDGVFAVVLKDGVVKAGDLVEVIGADPERPFSAAVITLSDRAFSGTYEDLSGPAVAGEIQKNGYEVIEQILLPDDREKLEAELCRLCDQRQVDVIFTTGGTGLSERDITPEATLAVCDREVPGIGEALRAYSANYTANAMLSRQTAGIRRRTLIVNLPGSPKACGEDLEFLMKPLRHGLGILRGTEDH